MSTEKFEHLDWSINAKEILDTPIHLVNKEHLWQLWEHFKDIKEKHYLNIDIVDASNVIISKIDTIMKLWNSNFSWEVMSAANNENYIENNKVA